MIPADWVPHRRREDGELVGYLRPEGERVVPCTLLGTALGPAVDWDEAEELLDDAGLSYLAEPWVLSEQDGSERLVLVLEVDADRVVVASADVAQAVGASADQLGRSAIPVPTDRLRRR